VTTILNRKATPMLPEPTIPKPQAAPAALQRPWVMTPLFCAPASSGSANPAPSTGRRAAPGSRRPSRRASSRSPAAQGNRGLTAVKTGPRNETAVPPGPGKDPADLLTVGAERLQRALWRSFLRYGVSGDLDTAVHAAMNVIGPVLAARDTEILRLAALAPPRTRRG
jgi:hypothetical protein